MSGIVYIQGNGGTWRCEPDLADRLFYQDHILVRAFNDVFGQTPEQDEQLLRLGGTPLYSSNSSAFPLYLNERLYTDGRNGCWTPDPRDAVPEYVGVRFDRPVLVTRFQFASGVHANSDCPGGQGPCSYPDTFALDGSNDGSAWTTLLYVEDYQDMQITQTSPFLKDDPEIFGGHVFLSGRMQIPNPGWFLSYRLRVLDFMPNATGGYNVSELIFYGCA